MQGTGKVGRGDRAEADDQARLGRGAIVVVAQTSGGDAAGGRGGLDLPLVTPAPQTGGEVQAGLGGQRA